jgi:predicted mannosyl-3-phosphoglycerate phosphatase (HAD superfamily)
MKGATQEAVSKLNEHSAAAQAVVQNALNSGLEEFRRETEQQLNKTLAEAKERVVSALLSLDEESRAACDARRQALETEVARSAEQAAEQFHTRIKDFLSTCLVAADGVVAEHSPSATQGLPKDSRKTRG